MSKSSSKGERVERVNCYGSSLQGYNVIDLVYHAISVARQQEPLMRQRPCSQEERRTWVKSTLIGRENPHCSESPRICHGLWRAGLECMPLRQKRKSKQPSERENQIATASIMHQCVGTMCCPVQSFLQSGQWGSSALIIYVLSRIHFFFFSSLVILNCQSLSARN